MAALYALVTSCTTPLSPKPLPVSEKIRFNQTLGSQLSRQLDPQLQLRPDAAVQAFLDKVAQKLADGTIELHIPKVRVFLVQDAARRWNSYALPGGRIYVSIGALKQLQFDNEVAALLAIQLAHLLKEHVLDYLRTVALPEDATDKDKRMFDAPEDVDFFSAKGCFAVDEKKEIDAIEGASDILYNGGYDSRGMLSLLDVFIKDPKHAPYSRSLALVLEERARRKGVQRAPIRNPIVHTKEFFQFSQRVEKL